VGLLVDVHFSTKTAADRSAHLFLIALIANISLLLEPLTILRAILAQGDYLMKTRNPRCVLQ